MEKLNWFVVSWGRDCDGVWSENNVVPGFFTKQMAERVAWDRAYSSDGVSFRVVDSIEVTGHCDMDSVYIYPWIHTRLDFRGSVFTQRR